MRKNFICRVTLLSKNTRERYFAECAAVRERCFQGAEGVAPQLRLLFCRVARGKFVGQRQRERILHYGRSCDGIATANYAGAIVWRSRVGRNVVILQFVFTADTIRSVIHRVFRAVVCSIGVIFVVVVSYYVRIVIAIVIRQNAWTNILFNTVVVCMGMRQICIYRNSRLIVKISFAFRS